ncbi:MAG TPA: VOC family protein [Cyclobacteriaceae bacterium]
METVSPNIFVHDIQETISFYKLLGFEIIASVPDASGKLIFVMMVNGSVTFMFQTFESIVGALPIISRNNGGSLLLYIKMKGIQSFFEQIRNKLTVLTSLEKTFYGATEFSIQDNNNYLITFAEDE